MNKWVMTVFNNYQWDLNYGNPAVFIEMLDIILFWANRGADIVRLDAVAFLWKKIGTTSQNEREAHLILQLTARALEGVVERVVEVSVALVVLRRAIDIDRAAVRQNQMDIDLVEAAGAVVAAGRLQDHAGRGNAAEALLKRRHLLVDGRTHVRPRLHALKINLDWRLHRALLQILVPDSPNAPSHLLIDARAIPRSLTWLNFGSLPQQLAQLGKAPRIDHVPRRQPGTPGLVDSEPDILKRVHRMRVG